MLVSFICYAFNLTLSTGGRYWDALSSLLASRITGEHNYANFSLSITTNWLGYILLGGFIFTFGVVELPAHWYIDEGTLRLLGIALLLMIVVYLWFCAFAKHRHITIKGQNWYCPHGNLPSRKWRYPVLTGW